MTPALCSVRREALARSADRAQSPAPLARLELTVALPILFARLPGLRLTAPPAYADAYHFHGLKRLMLRA